MLIIVGVVRLFWFSLLCCKSACDRPGAVCQDPRFIGGDGLMFYFHGKKDKDFCLVSDPTVHINAHFIGKSGKKGRDFTWVQSIGVLFGSHQLYIGAKKVSKWHESVDNMLIQLNGEEIMVPAGMSKRWRSPVTGVGTPPSETRGTHLTVTHGTHLTVTHDTHYQPDRHHPDFPKDIHDALLLSGPLQGRSNDTYKHSIRTALQYTSG